MSSFQIPHDYRQRVLCYVDAMEELSGRTMHSELGTLQTTLTVLLSDPVGELGPGEATKPSHVLEVFETLDICKAPEV